MFLGEYSYTIDDKGRVSIPAKMREVLEHEYNGRLILTRELDGCLAIYPGEEWEKVAASIKERVSLADRDGRRLHRDFFRRATECSLDSHGRIALPPAYREHAKIQKDVVIWGIDNRIEIWAKEVQASYDTQAEPIEDLVQKVGSLQI
jgi:MraZ protein